MIIKMMTFFYFSYLQPHLRTEFEIFVFQHSTSGKNDHFTMYSSNSILTGVHLIMMVSITRSHYFLMLIIVLEHYRGLDLLLFIPFIQNREFWALENSQKVVVPECGFKHENMKKKPQFWWSWRFCYTKHVLFSRNNTWGPSFIVSDPTDCNLRKKYSHSNIQSSWLLSKLRRHFFNCEGKQWNLFSL